MLRTSTIRALCLPGLLCCQSTPAQKASDEGPEVAQYLTLADGSQRLTLVDDPVQDADPSLSSTITIDTLQARQDMAGFGFALTGGSAAHIHGMSDPARAALLRELFSVEEGGIGMSVLRVTVGASDLESEPFSYNEDASDPEHLGFSLGPHLTHVIPVLQEILEVRPDLTILASPWSAPSWMKDTGGFIAGELLAEHRASYAAYLVRYIQEMASLGVDIHYLTVQNEPLHWGNNPSMTMTAADQALFVKDHLGPAFVAAGLDTKLITYDHNPDQIDYPMEVLDDPAAAQYLDGSAFHLYAGSIDALSTLHDAHPTKHVYFTEQWYSADGDFTDDFLWHVRHVLMGSVRNWSRGVIEWNLSSNPSLTPHTFGGCNRCLGAVTIDG
ncbi:MAG: glucosylceramidase, partial [Deltaproteobacteria bacterium]|nr:glucosylceramidase [Deltaproteobacteria bacterium]HCH64007.1 glucosylceramidase [Deltaproteobacteria bacterium]